MSTDEPDAEDLPPAVRETLDSLGGALGDIAELDKEQLNETIGLLETLGHDQAAGILRSRREVLKGAGAATGLGIAGLAGASATGTASAGDDQAGQFGTQAAPLDGYVEDLYDKNGNRVAELPGDGSLDVLQELSSQSVNAVDAPTVYVRSDGDDANDGLAEADAKATLQSAVDDAPLRPDQNALIVDVGVGTFGSLDLLDHYGYVRISGKGPNSTILDATGQNNGLNLWGTKLRISDLAVENAEERNLRLRRSSGILADNVRFSSAGDKNVFVSGQSSGRFINGCVFDDPGNTVRINIQCNQGSIGLTDSTVKGGNQALVEMRSGHGRVDFNTDATFIGEGQGVTNAIFRCFSTGNLKLTGATFEGADYLCEVGRRSTVSLTGPPTSVTDIGQRWNLRDAGIDVVDEDANEEYRTLPSNDPDPSPDGLDGGTMPGLMTYNPADGVAKYRSRQRGEWMQFGYEVRLETTLSFNGGQSRLVGNVNPGTAVEAVAVPANDPGNDHGYETELFYDTSLGGMRFRITETQNDGGGDAKIVILERVFE